MSTRKIEDLLSEGHNRFTPLQRLLTTASNQKQWTAEFRALLAPAEQQLSYQIQVTDIRGPVAWLACDTAATATRLRFLLPELEPHLQALQSFSSVTEFKIRVLQ